MKEQVVAKKSFNNQRVVLVTSLMQVILKELKIKMFNTFKNNRENQKNYGKPILQKTKYF